MTEVFASLPLSAARILFLHPPVCSFLKEVRREQGSLRSRVVRACELYWLLCMSARVSLPWVLASTFHLQAGQVLFGRA
ncbi:hypothetical protein FIBSPDRAFT_320742 [Athelia psychrophila]|uniref:Uncharacterized protein n=1 Tax=Athelia psychrophila TaxID=1759441 RepID=A0A166QI07_9AGAM|nr:hypothetical protein FIBSPDRAFT_320742 [Fibularhizoctonia sp. CBS 109695]